MAIITVHQVEKRIHTVANVIDILKGIDMSIKEGEAIAILGVSGSGKTTLLSLLAGLDLPTKGSIELDGNRLEIMTEDERARFRLGRIGFIFQNFELLSHMSALENVMLPLELNKEERAKEKAKALLEKVGLKDRLDHLPLQLSGGEQQRVAIARAYVTHPKVLFADEPTGCLDIETGTSVIEMIFELSVQLGTTLICVTHDPHLAQRCDRIFALKEGKLNLMINKV